MMHVNIGLFLVKKKKKKNVLEDAVASLWLCVYVHITIVLT